MSGYERNQPRLAGYLTVIRLPGGSLRVHGLMGTVLLEMLEAMLDPSHLETPAILASIDKDRTYTYEFLNIE